MVRDAGRHPVVSAEQGERFMTERVDSGAPVRRGRGRLLLASAAAAGGLIAGALLFGGGVEPAGANVASWDNLDLASAVGDNTSSGFAPVSAGVDGEGFVHLRGGITVTDAEMQRIGVTGGPWITAVNDDPLPCKYWPAYATAVVNGAYDETGVTDYGVGATIITPDGHIVAGGNSIPLIPDGTTMTATFTATLDNISWEAADPGCVDTP